MGRKLVHTLADVVVLAAIAGDRGAGGCRSWPGAIAGLPWLGIGRGRVYTLADWTGGSI